MPHGHVHRGSHAPIGAVVQEERSQLVVLWNPLFGHLEQTRRRNRTGDEFDALWLDFRNRFGLVWAQRVREQFNRAAVNAGWPVTLYWQGLLIMAGTAPPDPDTQEAIVATLRALLKRFRAERASPE